MLWGPQFVGARRLSVLIRGLPADSALWAVMAETVEVAKSQRFERKPLDVSQASALLARLGGKGR